MADENMQPVAYMHREGRIIRADVLLRSLDRAAGDSGPRARHDVGFTIELFTADQVAAKIRDGFDPRHPVAQNLIGRNARLSIALDIVRDILADDCEPTPITAEHWEPIHDQVQSVIRERNELREEVDRLRAALEVTPAPVTLEAAEWAIGVFRAEEEARRDNAIESVRKAMCALQRYSFLLNSSGGVSRVEDCAGRWIEWDEAHKLFDPEMVDWLLAKAQAAAAVNALPGLLDEVERLRADAARLDHIEKHARYDPKIDGNHAWWPTTFENVLRGPTLRAAIDAAMKEESGEQSTSSFENFMEIPYGAR